MIRRAAVSFLSIGTLMLAFVAYQLWGTALYEHHAQDRLRSQFAGHIAGATSSSSTTTNPGSDSGSAGANSAGGDAPTVGAQSPALAVAAAAEEAKAPPEGNPVALLSIPRIGMTNEAVVEGVAENDLQEGPGHYPGTALPGQSGNVAIAGHRTTYGAPFYNLDQLQAGDPITLQVAQGTFQYSVEKTLVVSPTDTSVLGPSPLPILTLTTCNPRYSSATRLVVVALLQQAQGSAGTQADPPPVLSSTSSSTTAPTPTTQPSSNSHPSSQLALAGDSSSSSSQGNVGEAVLWGEMTLLVFFLVRVFWRLGRGRARWGILSFGGVGVVLVLFVFFEHVSLALPASF